METNIREYEEGAIVRLNKREGRLVLDIGQMTIDLRDTIDFVKELEPGLLE